MSENLKNDIKSVRPVHKDSIKNKEPKYKEPKLKEPQYLVHCLIPKTKNDKKPIKNDENDKKM